MPSRSDRRRSPFRLFFALSLLIGAGAVWPLRTYLGLPWLACYLAGINLSATCAYAYDKAAAVRGYRRVPEKLLSLLAAVGGTPAAFLSQKVFRHKTIKRSGQMWFWGICAAQLALLAAWIYFAMPGK
ncbi:MAG: cold-shock DNA-binding domain protein [Phycisphaerales bacterium]|nr:cold-shock DNA-binding domain protein [Phycisphaerales bacterium]